MRSYIIPLELIRTYYRTKCDDLDEVDESCWIFQKFYNIFECINIFH